MTNKKTSKNKIQKEKEMRQFFESETLRKEREKADLADIPSEPDDKLLLEEFETQFSSNEPIRELLTAKNIRYKTQLTEEQRSAVAVLYHAYRLCLKYGVEFDGLKFVLDEYIDFGVSIDRKGRLEYVEAHKAQQQQLQQQSQGMNQMNNMKM